MKSYEWNTNRMIANWIHMLSLVKFTVKLQIYELLEIQLSDRRTVHLYKHNYIMSVVYLSNWKSEGLWNNPS